MDQITQPAWEKKIEKFWKIFISTNLRASYINPDPPCILADQYWNEENRINK